MIYYHLTAWRAANNQQVVNIPALSLAHDVMTGRGAKKRSTPMVYVVAGSTSLAWLPHMANGYLYLKLASGGLLGQCDARIRPLKRRFDFTGRAFFSEVLHLFRDVPNQ